MKQIVARWRRFLASPNRADDPVFGPWQDFMKVPAADFVAAAKAHGWNGFRLQPDLGNLDEILAACYSAKGQSILVDVPIDADQVIGLNPRLHNLKTNTYL